MSIPLSTMVFCLMIEAALFAGCAPKPVALLPPEPIPAQEQANFSVAFEELRAQYFSMLDYNESDSSRSQIVGSYASKLSAFADDVDHKLSIGEIQSDSERQLAGLVFVYDAMMTVGNSLGVIDGHLKLSELIKPGILNTRHHSIKDELAARFKRAANEFAKAKKLRPSDERIDGWILLPQAGLETLKQGKPSAKTLQAVLDLKTRPGFNTVTAMVLFKHENTNSALFSKLLKKMKNLIDTPTKEAKSRCKDYPQDCKNRFIAPYNIEVSGVFAGDLFLRQTEQLLIQGDRKGAAEMSAYARGIYAEMSYLVPPSELKQWSERPLLNARINYLDQLGSGMIPRPNSFQRTFEYNTVYQCASCHGRISEPNPYKDGVLQTRDARANRFSMYNHQTTDFFGQTDPTQTREALVLNYLNQFDKLTPDEKVETLIGSTKLMTPVCDGMRGFTPDQLQSKTSWRSFFSSHQTEISELDNAAKQKLAAAILNSGISNENLQKLSDLYSGPGGQEMKHFHDQSFNEALWQNEVWVTRIMNLYIKSNKKSPQRTPHDNE